ncbi:MAG: hypothetical protein MN733_37070 [Nitrososphaera sp.]|nr:hypothetical protein [Nitrososphaera sp.]
MSTETILARLSNESFETLFLQGAATAILQLPNAETNLATLIASTNVALKIRILAQELLIEAGYKPEQSMVELYCQAMPDVFLHNWWGMPGQYNERLGDTLVSFGEQALPCLSQLLNNEQSLGYFGSEEPTLSAHKQYRVCDLAAFLIASILGVPYEDADDSRERDEFNRELEARISIGQ